MNIEYIHGTALAPGQESDYSDLFGIGKSKAARAEAKVARQEKRAAAKILKERTKGAAERAKMGLEELPTIAADGAPAAGKSKILIFAGIGAAVLILVIVFIIKRKK